MKLLRNALAALGLAALAGTTLADDNTHNAEKTEVQSDGRIRKWARIAETGKFLRVILLEDGQTVHNAFFDRSFKESNQ
jgi:hypothetical protein